MTDITRLKIISLLKGAYFHIPIFTLYFLNHGVGLREIVFAQLFFSLSAFIGEIPTGFFADKYGQKVSIAAGYIIDIIPNVLMVLSPTTISLYIAYLLRGLVSSFQSGSEEALFYENLKRAEVQERKKEFSTFFSNETLGFVTATFIAGVIFQQFGAASYRPLFMATVVSTGIAAVLALQLKNIHAEIEDEEKSKKLLHAVKESWKLILNNKVVLSLALVLLLTLNGEYFIQAVYQPYFEKAGVTPFFIGSVLSFGALLNYVVKKNVYRLEKYFRLDAVLLGINILMGIIYIVMGFIVHPIVLVLLYIILQGVFNSELPLISDYINEHTRSHIRSTVLSSISFSRQLAKFFMRIIFGILVGVIGVGYSFVAQGIYLIIGVGIAFWIVRKMMYKKTVY